MKRNKLCYISLLSKKSLSLTLAIFLFGLSGCSVTAMDYSLPQKPSLVDKDGVRDYFENNNPNRKEFCNQMKNRHNATVQESLDTWDYLYTEKAIEYERLKRESQKYQYILAQLLPHLKILADKQKEEANHYTNEAINKDTDKE